MLSFDPSEIANWADKPDANGLLPTLIRRLILATVPTTSLLDVPSGSAVWMSGWDGLLSTDQENAWVPGGDSAWEFGSGQRPGSKANSDYAKRTTNQKGVDIASTTFVFVTPRKWEGKRNWANKRRQEGKWFDVRALDATDLVSWLEQAPAVAQWFARLIGKLPESGWLPLDEWWQNWATATQHSIKPALVLAGRSECAGLLEDWAQQSPSHYYVQGDTREEAIAFVAACAQRADEKWRAGFLAKAIVVDDSDTWRSLERHWSPLVLIRNFSGNISPGIAVGAGHHVLTPLHSNEDTRGNGSILPRLGRDETVRALEDMGISEVAARDLVSKTARRLPIMRRFLIDEAGGANPAWWASNEIRSLVPLILIGQWDEANKCDKSIVAQIVGSSYEEIVRDAMTLLTMDESPLTKVGSRWRFVSHEEAWHLLAPRLTEPDVEKFKSLAIEVLGTASPEFEMPIDERHLAGVRGQVLPHSGTIREGIARTLALMGTSGERARGVEGASYAAEAVVRGVLTGGEPWQIWATLSPHLATLAEAAPEAVLDAVEASLAAESNSVADLFIQEGDGLFNGAPHTGVLWALERLAWSEEHFARVATTLAQLAELDPGGRVSNRPAASLVDMFLPWFRLSLTTDENRITTLGMLLDRFPKAGWQLLIDVYPDGHSFVVNRRPPSWRPWGQDGVPQPTKAQCRAFVEELERLLLEHVDDDSERWGHLVGIVSDLSPEIRCQAAELLADRIDTIREQAASRDLWVALRRQLNRHRSYPDAEWALSPEELEPFDDIYRQLEPDDPEDAYGWLFDYWPDLPQGTNEEKFDAHRMEVEKAQLSAVEAAYRSGGTAAVLAIAECAKEPGLVGRAFGLKMATEESLALAANYLGAENQHQRMMARGVVNGIFSQLGWESLDVLVERVKASRSDSQAVADIFLSASVSRDTWQRLEQEEAAVQERYWKSLNVWAVPALDEQNLTFVAEEFLKVGRSPAAARLLAYRQCGHEVVIQTLEQLPSGLATSAALESPLEIRGHDVARLFEKLDQSEHVGDATIAALELPFVGLLRHYRPDLAVYREIAKDPALFADFIAVTCKADDGSTADTYDERVRQILTEILVSITFGAGEMPGKVGGDLVDAETLSVWVSEARRLCGERGREEAGDEFIGQLLAKSPTGADGIWPCEPVRDLLDEIRSQRIAHGVVLGKHNLRGVTSRGAFEGGGQEQTLADDHRAQAAKIAARWPFTSSLLRSIADSYRRESAWHEHDASWRDQFEQ